MRILYVPNEASHFRQQGIREALGDLKFSNLIEDFRVFSLLLRVAESKQPKVQIRLLSQLITEFKPDVVLLQHMGGSGLNKSYVEALRSLHDFKLI